MNIKWAILYDSILSEEDNEKLKSCEDVEVSLFQADHVHLDKRFLLSKRTDVIHLCKDRRVTGILIFVPHPCNSEVVKALEAIMEDTSSFTFVNKVALIPIHKEEFSDHVNECNYDEVTYNAVSIH